MLPEADIKSPKRTPRPEWLKVRLPSGEGYTRTKHIVKEFNLHTVCEDARCPNMAECWGNGTATFMILGDICTRSCGFCNVKTGRPTELDLDEPRRVAEAIVAMGINYAVVTSVNRDELTDGGASIFAETIRQIREKSPECTIEVLIPDFKGDHEALLTLLNAKPDVLNHNIETIPRLYSKVRPQADYEQSLELIQRAKNEGVVTKSGMMVGLGEESDEVLNVMEDLKSYGCDIATIGQYLQPSKKHLPVDRYVHPLEFAEYKAYGYVLGFDIVESGPLVRSSYHAENARAILSQ
ncbi:lipoyl synthase [Candidatus Marinimicrobia bacterium MT.SAG.3]|nr:lipoyl synthase [Candidatus Marinimicrobia bacterium MT.SAG.3]